jgi:hypothetical protein
MSWSKNGLKSRSEQSCHLDRFQRLIRSLWAGRRAHAHSN